MQDPRPLKDGAFQSKIGQELVDYLTANNFEGEMKHALSKNVTRSPAQKDVNYMFQWLYHRIDPSYRFVKNIDEEMLSILKQLHYPYERMITKSQLAAVGGQNWGMFLGILHWMMQLIQMLEGYTSNKYNDACIESGVDIKTDHIIFDFLSRGYKDWLAIDEETGDEEAAKALIPHVNTMARAIEQSNYNHVSKLEALEAENLRLKKEIGDLQRSPTDPAALDNQFHIMEEDKIKFQEYNALAIRRSEKYESRAQTLQEGLNKLFEDLQAAEQEKRRLQTAIGALGVSTQDIDRMLAERERVQKMAESASLRLENVERKVADKQAEATRKLDELERMAGKYNDLAYQIGLIPPTAANARGAEYEVKVITSDSLNFTSQLVQGGERLITDATTDCQPEHVLNVDLRGKIKHHLVAFRDEILERRSESMDRMTKDYELLDGMKESIEDKRSEVEALEHRVRAAEEEYEKIKETTTAHRLGSDAQIEKMGKEIYRLRANMSESVQLME